MVENQSRVYDVCFGNFDKDAYWLELLESNIMRELAISYIEDDKKEVRGSGRPEKSSISKCIAVTKNEIVKQIMKAGKKAHGHRIRIRRSVAGGKKREKGVFKQGSCVYLGTEIASENLVYNSDSDNDDSDDVEKLKSIISNLQNSLKDAKEVHIFYYVKTCYLTFSYRKTD